MTKTAMSGTLRARRVARVFSLALVLCACGGAPPRAAAPPEDQARSSGSEPSDAPAPVRFEGEVPVADLSAAYEAQDDATLDPSWCARCTLPARIAERTAPGSIDCGNVTLSRGQAVGACPER